MLIKLGTKAIYDKYLTCIYGKCMHINMPYEVTGISHATRSTVHIFDVYE